MEFVESKISKKYDSTSADESFDESKKRKAKNGEAEKLKASNILASRLRINRFELSHMLSFRRESDPQPRKHTIWHATPDFTGGQASVNRMHWIQFRKGELEKHYEKLLQCDKRLLMLSQKPFPYYDPPLFDNKNHSGHEEFAFEFIGH
ncbi:hypothetical protein Syun_021947 [Stephania yunnanensis]|uniref:TRF2/HOY1 PH-like domain-containing protein n=1 Tax=Stephania yunnanensis TaxID=152371 RepID=A0AAP0NRK5_9MAGN